MKNDQKWGGGNTNYIKKFDWLRFDCSFGSWCGLWSCWLQMNMFTYLQEYFINDSHELFKSIMFINIRVEKTGKHKFHLSVPPKVNPELLGCTPRQRYPCVIVMAAVSDSSSVIEANVVSILGMQPQISLW